MKSRGSESGPFQLFIGIVVFGMALVIGAYLFDMVNCWKCKELVRSEAIQLRESIASVGKGDTNSRENILIEIEELGACASKGLSIRKVSADANLNCESFCPQHPNSCWVIITPITCGNSENDVQCIDISGQMEIDDPDNILFDIQTSDNPWLVGSSSIMNTMSITIEKTGPLTIEIKKPGS